MMEVAAVVDDDGGTTCVEKESDDLYENPLLDEMDSYWDEVNDRLTVSRMVSDSVIKGIVSAVQQEAAERIALKDATENGKLSGLLILEREVGGLISGIEEELVCEQQRVVSRLSKDWRRWVDDVYAVREGLNGIYQSFFSFELGVLASSHRSFESIEEWNGGKKKDHFLNECGGGDVGTEESAELGKPISEQLMRKTKEELVRDFRREMSKMKRQHDVDMQKTTEELFRLKRDLLKEKGSSPLHFRKEKDFEVMKKKLSELILKLDGILAESKKVPVVVVGGRDMSLRLKERVDAFISENHWLQRLPVDERVETSHIASQASSREANMMEEIERLQLALEKFKVEATIKEEKYMSVIKDLVGEVNSEREGLETLVNVIDDNYCTVYKGAIADALSNINPILETLNQEKDFINTQLIEKEKSLCLEIEKNGRLSQEIASLLTLVKEKEKFGSEASSQLVQQQEQYDLVFHELNLYKDQTSKQEIIIASLKSELDLLKDRLDETVQQIHQNEVEISHLNQKLNIATDALRETEIQNGILQSNIQEKEEMMVAAIMTANIKEKEQKSQLDSIIVSIIELSKAICDSESKMTQKMQANESRLKELSHQCNQLKSQANLLNRKVSWYKDRFEARCEDLQKAENEVDLLGDEVDTLLDLLQKIYMALDHYSPVLQHYPGVVETLKLIGREMKGETPKSARPVPSLV